VRGELLIDLIHEFWTDSDELLDVKRKQITQANREYLSKYPKIKGDVSPLELSTTYVDLLTTYIFYPHYMRYFQGIPVDYNHGVLRIITDTVRQERQLKRLLKGITDYEFIFAHRSCILFLHDIVSHYFQRYPPSEGIIIKWLIINRAFATPTSWYNPVVKKLLDYRQRPLATLTMAEFGRIVDSRPGAASPTESAVIFLSDVFNIPLDPAAPTPESTWESTKPVTKIMQDSVAKEKGYPIVDLSEEIVDLKTFQSFPLYYLKKHRLIPLRIEEEHLVVAVVDPACDEALSEIKQTSQSALQIKIIREEDFYRLFYNLVNHFLKF